MSVASAWSRDLTARQLTMGSSERPAVPPERGRSGLPNQRREIQKRVSNWRPGATWPMPRGGPRTAAQIL